MNKKLFLIASMFFLSHSVYAVTAIFYSEQTGTIHKSTLKKTSEEAYEKAKNGCNKEADDCEFVLISDKAGYGATVNSRGNRIFFNSSLPSKKAAISDAFNQCRKQYRNCELVSTFYDPIPAPPPPPVQQCYGVNGPAPCGSLYDYGGYNIYTGKPMYNHGGTGSTP